MAGSLGATSRPLWRRPLLLGAAVLGPVVEAAALLLAGLRGSLALAPQATGIAPFGVFHDLRWLLVYHNSRWVFAAGAVALVAVRTAVTTTLISAAWPDTVPRPRWWRLARPVASATAAAALLLSPWAALLFGVAVVPFSWLFFAAVPPALLTLLLLHHAPISGARWWQLPPLRSVGWVLLAFAVYTLAALTMSLNPAGPAVVVAAASGLFNAWGWHGLVHAVVLHRPVPRPIPTTPLALALLALLVAGGTELAFVVRGAPEVAGSPGSVDGSTGRPVLVVPGYAGACCEPLDALLGSDDGLVGMQFSYRGLDAAGRPLPHAASATDRPLEELVELLAAHVAELYQRTGRPVSIVAESEGTLVAKAYLLQHPDAPVDQLIMLSPIVRPARVSYPPRGRDGWGVVAGYELRAVTAAIRALTPFEISADGPLLTSLRTRGAVLRDGMVCDLSGVRQIAFVPLADAVTLPLELPQGIQIVVVPGFHGGMLGRPDVRAQVRTLLLGGEATSHPGWVLLQRVVSSGAAAWHVPDLADEHLGVDALASCPRRQRS